MAQGYQTLQKSLIEAEHFYRAVLKNGGDNGPEMLKRGLPTGVHLKSDGMVYSGTPTPTIEIEKDNFDKAKLVLK